MHLFDVNVLIALGDPFHVHRPAALAVLRSAQADGWATCPLTQSGFLRIIGHPNYPQGPGSTQLARQLLAKFTALPGHQFWADDLSFTDFRVFAALPGARHLTDLYLLAMAVKHRARFASFDRRIDPALVPGGPEAYFIIPTA